MGCCSTTAAQADDMRNTPLDSLGSPAPTQCAFESESQSHSSPRSPPLPQSTEHPPRQSDLNSSNNDRNARGSMDMQPSAATATPSPVDTNADSTQQPLSQQADSAGEHHTYSNPLGLPVELLYQASSPHGQLQDTYSQQGSSTPASQSYTSGDLMHASTDALATGLGFAPSPLMAVLGRGVREQEADRTVAPPSTEFTAGKPAPSK